jgi:hypothetical protein
VLSHDPGVCVRKLDQRYLLADGFDFCGRDCDALNARLLVHPKVDLHEIRGNQQVVKVPMAAERFGLLLAGIFDGYLAGRRILGDKSREGLLAAIRHPVSIDEKLEVVKDVVINDDHVFQELEFTLIACAIQCVV